MNKKREKIGRCFFHSKGAIERRKVNEELNKSIFLLNYQEINKLFYFNSTKNFFTIRRIWITSLLGYLVLSLLKQSRVFGIDRGWDTFGKSH